MKPRLALRRREEGRRLLVVRVEREPDGDASALRLDDRVAHDLRSRLEEIEVVEREVEAPASVAEEGGELVGDLQRGLAAVGERAHLDHGGVTLAAVPAACQA